MQRKLKLIAGSSVLIGGLAFAAYADPQQNAPPSPASDHGMTGGQGGMMQQMPSSPGGDHGMMSGQPGMIKQMSPEMMQEMTRMMENCNRMMESYMQQLHPTPAPQPQKKG